MKVKHQPQPLELGQKVKALVELSDGRFDLLRGEVVNVFDHETEQYKYRILGNTHSMNAVVAHVLHTDDTLMLDDVEELTLFLV